MNSAFRNQATKVLLIPDINKHFVKKKAKNLIFANFTLQFMTFWNKRQADCVQTKNPTGQTRRIAAR